MDAKSYLANYCPKLQKKLKEFGPRLERTSLCPFKSANVNSAIHKAAGLMVPGRSKISAGTIPVEQKSVHWLSMGTAGWNVLLEGIPACGFLEWPVTKELVAL